MRARSLISGVVLFSAGLFVVPGAALAAPNDNSTICTGSVLAYSQNIRNSLNQIEGVIQLRYCSGLRATFARVSSNGVFCDVGGPGCTDGTVRRLNDAYTRSCLSPTGTTGCTSRGAGDIANTVSRANATGNYDSFSPPSTGTTLVLSY